MAKVQKSEIQDLRSSEQSKHSSNQALYQQLVEKQEDLEFLNRRIQELIHINQVQAKKNTTIARPESKFKED